MPIVSGSTHIKITCVDPLILVGKRLTFYINDDILI